MEIIHLIIYAFIGVIAGLASGLFGIGGGIITVPCLLFIFHEMGFPPVYMMQLAIGTSLAAMIFTTLVSAISHYNKGAVLTGILKKMVWGLIFGSIIGAFLGHIFPAVILQLLFAIFLVLFGIQFYRKKEFINGAKLAPISDKWGLAAISIGGLASFLGLGGGLFSVPFLTHRSVPIKKAIGTASATSFIISIVGALSYLLFGFGEAYYPHTLGYIYLPAFGALAVFSVVSAPLGVKLAHRLHSEKLKKAFAVVLIIVGIFMFIR